jgi:hypothetical protein
MRASSARETGDEDDIERIVGWKRAVEHRVGDTPAPAELHGADVHLVHLRRDDRAVGLLDELAGHAMKAELGGEREADRSAADDEEGNSAGHSPGLFRHSRHGLVWWGNRACSAVAAWARSRAVAHAERSSNAILPTLREKTSL